jgi:hypothetical protein
MLWLSSLRISPVGLRISHGPEAQAVWCQPPYAGVIHGINQSIPNFFFMVDVFAQDAPGMMLISLMNTAKKARRITSSLSSSARSGESRGRISAMNLNAASFADIRSSA